MDLVGHFKRHTLTLLSCAAPGTPAAAGLSVPKTDPSLSWARPHSSVCTGWQRKACSTRVDIKTQLDHCEATQT